MTKEEILKEVMDKSPYNASFNFSKPYILQAMQKYADYKLREQLTSHKCKPMVNAEWTYLRCECGRRFEPKG